MIAWWWLLIVGWGCGCVGFFTAALMAASKAGDIDLTPRGR